MSTDSGFSPGQNSCFSWEDYPIENAVYFTPGKTRAFYRQLLGQDPTQIFEADLIAFEVIHMVHASEALSNPGVETRKITSIDQLNDELLLHGNKCEQHIFLLPQVFSWGQLQTTKAAFQQLLASCHVFAPFLNIVHEFGSKTRDGFVRRNLFYRYYNERASLSIKTGLHDYELSYLLQYVEENGRNHGDPWSLRQTGIYQQANIKDERSTWIILQLSRSTRGPIESALHSQLNGTKDSGASLHSILLLSTMDNWGGYIEHLHSQLRNVDEKACFSKIGMASSYDYSIEFSDMQALQRLRYKVLAASSVLESCLNIATRLKAHCCEINESGRSANNDRMIMSMETYAAGIKAYQQSIANIVQSLQGTFDLLSKIIEFRNIENLQEINRASERSVSFLRESVSQIHEETRQASTISVQTQKDAKTVKALATISMIFLPASLIATIFSSTLVEVQQRDNKGNHFVLATQFWIYILASIGLTLIAIGCTRFLEYRSLKGLLLLES